MIKDLLAYCLDFAALPGQLYHRLDTRLIAEESKKLRYLAFVAAALGIAYAVRPQPITFLAFAVAAGMALLWLASFIVPILAAVLLAAALLALLPVALPIYLTYRLNFRSESKRAQTRS